MEEEEGLVGQEEGLYSQRHSVWVGPELGLMASCAWGLVVLSWVYGVLVVQGLWDGRAQVEEGKMEAAPWSELKSTRQL